ncbi:hypothetical protein Pst134EA_015842 [Puccinia striiformis f. sp. tritici]|uniref:hypothetical protein n=1 Tax=Puccinia striiformis f. sp. tritici TaxID=168172 RepID=UPI002007D0D3|nr:hypothetical protein Pst134EA_015842 [Puccinia striiformis f. sp. tritici]KAH9463758.1 hypothetical protein Pst134EA_015842 [Puccinia striiformis f. sp. tritici]
MADSSKSFSTSRSTFSQQPYSHQHLGTLAGADELGGLVSRLLALDPKATEENIAQVESLGLKPTTIDEPEAVPGWSEAVPGWSEAVPAADPASPALNANEAKTKSKAFC